MAANEPNVELDALVRRVYEEILQTANRFLTHGRRYRIEILALEDPSYENVATLINDARRNINDVMDQFDPMLAQQAEEYCLLMIKIGAAIKAQDAAALTAHCDELERKPFAMP